MLTVSTIIPTYNRAPLLPRAIGSVLAQLERDDELIVVDDESTDETPGICARFGGRVRYVRVPHRGAGAARNAGIREARRDLVAFLDSDDEWMPGKLHLQRAVMQAYPDVLFCFTNMASRLATGEIRRCVLDGWHGDPRPWHEILGPARGLPPMDNQPPEWRNQACHVGTLYLAELERNYVAAQALVVRRREAGAALHFAEDLPVYEDWECFARLAGCGLGAYVDCETVWQHGHHGVRLTDADELTCARAHSAIIRRVWGADAAFLQEHGDLYHRVLRAQELRAARELLSLARTGEAREVLRAIDRAPLGYRALAALPSRGIRGLLKVRRRLRGLLARGA